MSDSSSKSPKDTPSSSTLLPGSKPPKLSRERLRKYKHGYPTVPGKMNGKRGQPHKSPADPVKLLGRALNLLKGRLEHLRINLQPSMWSVATSREVTDYVRTLAQVVRERQDAEVDTVKELRELSIEELQDRAATE